MRGPHKLKCPILLRTPDLAEILVRAKKVRLCFFYNLGVQPPYSIRGPSVSVRFANLVVGCGYSAKKNGINTLCL